MREADEDGYDGLGAYALEDQVAWERDGVELPEPEQSGHRELSDAEIARWDARVDAWAEARGFSLADEPASGDPAVGIRRGDRRRAGLDRRSGVTPTQEPPGPQPGGSTNAPQTTTSAGANATLC